RGDVEPWPLKLPVDWAADPYNDRNWRFQLNAWRMTDPILNEYFKTKSPDLLKEALAFVDDWYRFHFIAKIRNPYACYDMAAGIRALRLAFLIDAANDDLFAPTDSQMAHLLRMADEH